MRRRGSALAACAFALVACRDKATREECERMMERYVDLAIAEDPELAALSKQQMAVVREVKRELKLAEPGYRKVHDACESRVTKKEYDCAVDAKTIAAWDACIE